MYKANRKDLLELDGGLLRFLQPTAERLRVLVVESLSYLPELRRMMPQAELFAVTAEPDYRELPEYQGLGIAWEILDYHETPLPYARESFDYILSDRCLETAANGQDIAAGFGTYIKQTGFLLTSFKNIRHWKVLQELMEGHFYAVITRLFTKPEFESLLYASFYKDAVFMPQRSYAPEELLERLVTCGFENRRHDLETEFWLVKAARSTPEIAALKECFTKETRRALSRYLRRIEYGIDVEANSLHVWQLYEEQGMFLDYLAAFIREAVVHYRPVFQALCQSAAAAERAGELLQAACASYTRPEDLQMLTELLEAGGYDR